MDLYKQFGTNKGKETKGTWIDIDGDYTDDKRPGFLLARMGGSNREFEKALDRKLRPHKIKARRRGAAQDVDSKVLEAITLDTFVETVLLDWRNITKGKKQIEYNAENAKTLFRDLPDLYVVLLTESQDIKVFQDEQQDADSKN